MLAGVGLAYNIVSRTYTALAVSPATAVVTFAIKDDGSLEKTPGNGPQPGSDEWIRTQPVPQSQLANYSVRVRTISGSPSGGAAVNTWINFAITPSPTWSKSQTVFGVSAWVFQIDISATQNGAAPVFTSGNITLEAEVELP